MFGVMIIVLSIGYPVAFSFGAISLVFGGIAIYFDVFSEGGFTLAEFSEEFMILFSQMPLRIYNIMTNKVLLAVPLFIFMGIVLQKSELANKLLKAIGTLFGNTRGGIAIGVMLVGTLLASSTGVVGASVVAMGVISLPVMMKYGYNKPLACGTICASGTLGQIIPPSIVLIILADVFGQPVGDLFKAAIGPSLVLVALYIIYILLVAYLYPELAPAIENDDNHLSKKEKIIQAIKAIIPPLILIISVLGSIFMGIATPTESASIGAVGSLVLAFIYKKFSINIMIESAKETVKITSMVFAILIGATAFSLVFVYTGADMLVEEFMTSLPGDKWGFIILSMLIILFLGFFYRLHRNIIYSSPYPFTNK